MGITETFQNLFNILSNFSFKTFFTQTLPGGLGNTLTLGIVILVVFGIAECLFGWQLLRFELTIGVFAGVTAVSGFIISRGMLDAFLPEAWMQQLVMVVLGLVMAIFTWYHSNLIFFLGVMISTGAAIFFVLSRTFDNVVVVAVIATVLSIPLAFLLKQLLMPLVVSVSAIGGAFLVGLSIAGFFSAVLPAVGIMIMTDLTVTGLIIQVRRLLKSKVNHFMRSTMRSTNMFLSRYEGDVASISRNFFSRIGF